MTTSAGPSIAEGTHEFSIALELLDGYAFRIAFDHDELEPLHTDEPPPLGHGSGPSPSRLLAAAIANCLAASLLHCLRRARVGVRKLSATATVTLGRNERGRVRVQRVTVQLAPELDESAPAPLTRCIDLFREYCTVTASIHEGFDIDVHVLPVLPS